VTARWLALNAAALMCLAYAAPASGQIAGAEFCSSVVYDNRVSATTGDPLTRMHPLVSRARYAEAVRDEQWVAALRGLRDDAAQAFVKTGVPLNLQAIFFAQIDSTVDVLGRLPGPADPARARFVADSVRPIRFLPIAGVDAFHLFRNPQLALTGSSDDQQRALCWSAMSIDLVLFRLSKPLEGGSLARLARLNTAWSNYRTYGYTRQPLELLLFRGSVRDSLPPKTQILVGHLSLGMELSGSIHDSVTSVANSVLEFGVLRYRSNYQQYFGASGILDIASGQNVGYGGMVHVARSLRGGVVFRRIGGETHTSFVVSTDLYGMLERSKRSVDQGLAIAKGLVVLPPRP
jgi:hypothetical protein